MSAKRSFDLESRPAPRKRAAARRPARAKREPAARRRKTLREKRADAQGVKNMLMLAGVAAIIGTAIYGFWRPEVRIVRVIAANDTYVALAQSELEGAYYHVFPRDSFFFYPENAIREAILAESPEVSSVSVSREGFDAIQITTTERRSALRWCGTPYEAPAVSHECYEADADGMLFRVAEAENASSTMGLRVYAELDTASSTMHYPLRAKVMGVDNMRDVLRFVEDVQSFSVPVHALGIRGDEADLYTPQGTRITYVIGKEREAKESASAAFPKLNLVDGSVQYVDLRFPGKVYVKRAGE